MLFLKITSLYVISEHYLIICYFCTVVTTPGHTEGGRKLIKRNAEPGKGLFISCSRSQCWQNAGDNQMK